MRATVGYVLAALALGGIGYCGSEALFWSFPPEGVTLLDWALTIVAYALAGACALSAVVWPMRRAACMRPAAINT